MSAQQYYGQPQYPPQAYGHPQGYGPPPPQGYGQPPPMQYQYQQGPPPQQRQRSRGCFEACMAALCCCFVAEEGCECLAGTSNPEIISSAVQVQVQPEPNPQDVHDEEHSAIEANEVASDSGATDGSSHTADRENGLRQTQTLPTLRGHLGPIIANRISQIVANVRRVAAEPNHPALMLHPWAVLMHERSGHVMVAPNTRIEDSTAIEATTLVATLVLEPFVGLTAARRLLHGFSGATVVGRGVGGDNVHMVSRG